MAKTCTPHAGVLGLIPGQGTRSPTPQLKILHATAKVEDPMCCNYGLKSESESEVAQSCPTLCDPVDCSPPGSSVHGIPLARILELVAMPSSRGSSQPRNSNHVSCGCCTASRFFIAEPSGKPQTPWYFSLKNSHFQNLGNSSSSCSLEKT